MENIIIHAHSCVHDMGQIAWKISSFMLTRTYCSDNHGKLQVFCKACAVGNDAYHCSLNMLLLSSYQALLCGSAGNVQQLVAKWNSFENVLELHFSIWMHTVTLLWCQS
jgi:hypothetical protein